MAFPVFAAIGAGLNMLSGFLGSRGSSSGSFDLGQALVTQQLQKDLFDYQFSKQMESMNTAHQREVTDLKKAGLNPILSATGGSGLNSPTGSMPDISSVNSAITASKQADRQMKMNALLGFLDAGLKYQQNQINDKSADASLQNAKAASDQATASLMNAEQNAINTSSQVQERWFKMSNLDADTKKKLAEINLVNSNMYVNSALAQKYATDAYVARELLPWQQYNYGTSGSVAGTVSYPFKWLFDKVSDFSKKNSSSAKENIDKWLKIKGSGMGFLGK